MEEFKKKITPIIVFMCVLTMVILFFFIIKKNKKNIEPKTVQSSINQDTLLIKDYFPINEEKLANDRTYSENVLFLNELQKHINENNIITGYCYVLSFGNNSTMAEFISDSSIAISRKIK